jgi:hypothetical protein
VFPIDPAFFADERARRRLIDFTLALIANHRADKVGWTFTGIGIDEEGGGEDILTAIVVDREVEECWTAPLIRGIRPDDVPVLHGWALQSNEGAGFMVTPIQEALR